MDTSVLQLSLIFLIVGTLIIVVFKKLKTIMTANGKKGLFYLLGTLLLFGIAGFLSKESLFSGSLLVNFIIIQTLFLLYGILHLVAMNAFLSWEDDIKRTGEVVFTIVAVLLGSLAFLNATEYFGVSGFHFFFLSGVIAFFIPILFYRLWKTIAEFPVPIFQQWHYPLAKAMSLPDMDELRNLRIISLEFSKTPGAAKSIFKAKAPENMNFGKFFYHFINDYNHRVPESPISYKDENNHPCGWLFYVKPNIISTTRNVNPELTIHANRIKEHTTIICQRVVGS